MRELSQSGLSAEGRLRGTGGRLPPLRGGNHPASQPQEPPEQRQRKEKRVDSTPTKTPARQGRNYPHKADNIGITCFFLDIILGRNAQFSSPLMPKA